MKSAVYLSTALFVSIVLFLSAANAVAQESSTEAEPEKQSSAHWPSPEKVAEHEEKIEWYRAARFDSLRQPESWLSLVGLYWLREGVTSVGSGDDMGLHLPDSVPEYVGELTETASDDGRTTVFTPAAGVEVKVDGQIATGPVELRSDADGEPSQVEVGSVVFYALARRDQTAIRVKDRQAKTLKEFDGLEYFPIDWRWRIEGRYVPYENGKEIEVPSFLGGTDPAKIPGYVEFEKDGETFRIDALPSGESLFLVFGDRTNGDTTYGGGRFLYIDAPPASNREAPVEIDFNKAYSPPCVFSPWATCPLPPRQNRLALAITAGEKMYTGWTEGSH